MSSYHTFTSGRTTEPDFVSLLTQLRAADATAGLIHAPGPTYVVKKATAWTAPQISTAQGIIDAAPVATKRLGAQQAVDEMSIFDKALVLMLLDEFNVVRAALQPPLPARTSAQVIAAFRAKAGTL